MKRNEEMVSKVHLPINVDYKSIESSVTFRESKADEAASLSATKVNLFSSPYTVFASHMQASKICSIIPPPPSK